MLIGCWIVTLGRVEHRPARGSVAVGVQRRDLAAPTHLGRLTRGPVLPHRRALGQQDVGLRGEQALQQHHPRPRVPLRLEVLGFRHLGVDARQDQQFG